MVKILNFLNKNAIMYFIYNISYKIAVIAMSSLYKKMNYVDGITIINNEGTILFTVKFNQDIDKKREKTIVGKKLFDVFYNLNKLNSTLFECMNKEIPVERKGQLVKNLYSGDTYTDNISFPIKYEGVVVGAIELSKSINSSDGPNRSRENNEGGSSAMSLNPKCLDLGYRAIYNFDNIIRKNDKMIKLVEYAKNVAKSSAPVLIVGETGTGKELFAHGIHNASDRRDKPFIAQNCSAVPENLLESIFFGSSKGSYTGALDKKGLFEACDGGTLFLDELHCMPFHLQAKLLRAIESKTVRRVGENQERKFDVRIIAATNIKSKDILTKRFIREDLYYRLSVVKIEIPPLRERIEDIEILSNHFMKKYNAVFEKNITSISKELMRFLLNYDWPGNVRELENYIESSILSAPADDNELKAKDTDEQYNNGCFATRPMKKILEEHELNLIKEALLISKGNVKKAAEYLEIPRQTLQQKMKKYDISKVK